MLLGVIEGYALFEVGVGQGEFPEVEGRHPQCPVGLQEEGRVVLLLGQTEELLGQLPSRMVLCPYQIKPLQAPQHWKELRRLARLRRRRA